MTERELGWVAGIIEGEASIGNLRPTIQIETTDRWLVHRLDELVPGGVMGQRAPRGIGRKQVHTWRLNKAVLVKELLEQILPLLSPRRRERANESLSVMTPRMLAGRRNTNNRINTTHYFRS